MTSPEPTPSESKGGRNLLVAAGAALGLLVVLVVLFSHSGLYHIYRFRQDKARLDQENARLAEENDRLTRTIDRLQHDPEMIQEFIRRELNFVKKNEIIFQLPPGKQSKQAGSASGPGVASRAEAQPTGGSPQADRRSWPWRFLEGAPKPVSTSVQ